MAFYLHRIIPIGICGKIERIILNREERMSESEFTEL